MAIYTGNFTVPAMLLSTSQSASTNIAAVSEAQTSLLTLQSVIPVDNSVNAATVTILGNPITNWYSALGANTFALSIFNIKTGSGATYYTGVQFRTPPVWSAYSAVASAGGAILYQLAATGATSYYLTSGDLSGLSLSTSGLLTGTYSAGTPISVVVTAYNAYGLGTPQTVTVTPSITVYYLVVAGGGAGTPTSGGGGGSGGNHGGPTGSGAGVGLVQIALPTTQISGYYPSSVTVTTPPAAPGYTVLTYTTSGTYTT